jgi:hypothetical protein
VEETSWGPWRKWNWIIQDGVTGVLEFTHSKEGLLTGFYEYGNNASCPRKVETFLEYMGNC